MLSSPKKRICPSASCNIWENIRRQPSGDTKGKRPSITRTRANAVRRLVASTGTDSTAGLQVPTYFLGAGAAGALLPPRKMRKKSDEDGSSTITSLFLLKLAR